MPKNLLAHTSLLTLAVVGVFLWLSSPLLSSYALQLVGVLILAFAAAHWYRRPKRLFKPGSTITLDITLLVVVILLLVTLTGSLASPFFFLLYFLLFAVALLYEIEATLTLTAILILYFLLLPQTDLFDLAHLSELFALLAVTPLAIYIAHQKELLLRAEFKSQTLKSHLAQEETDTLTFLSLNLKSTLLSALDQLSLIIPATGVKKTRADLQLLYQDLRNLYRSADELERLVDAETDQE